MATETIPERTPAFRKPAFAAGAAAQHYTPARPAQLGEANCRLLLALLRSNTLCSQADLVRASGLSSTTVSSSIARLSKLGLIHAAGGGVSSGGRPPGLLKLNGAHCLVAAADLGGTRLRMMLADLGGDPVQQWTTELGNRQKTPAAIVRLLRLGLREMLQNHGTQARVHHITVAAPGITDVEHGVVLAAPNLDGWSNVPLRTLVEQELQLTATVENDTNLAAVGERSMGLAQGVDDFLFLAIGTGVGAGIFLRGALHHGVTWSAGEIGYLPVAGRERQALRIKETGQLEQAIGGKGIEAMWRLLSQREQAVSVVARELRATEIFDLAEQGHTTAGEVLQATARTLAIAVETVAVLFNPRLIVLGGGVGSHPALCRSTAALLQASDFPLPALRSSVLGTQAQLFGAVSVALATADAKLFC